jgi:MFS family permease
LLAAAITVVGALAYASSPASRDWRAPVVARTRFGALESPALRFLLVLILLTGLMWGSLAVGLPALAVGLGSRSDAGALLALLSIGSLIGGLTIGAASPRASVEMRYRLLLGLPALAAVPLFVAHSLISAALFSFVAGLPWAALMSCQYMLVGSTAPPGAVTEAYTWSTAALMGGVSLGSPVAGWLIDHGGARLSFVVVCGAGLFATVIALVVRRQLGPFVPSLADTRTVPVADA